MKRKTSKARAAKCKKTVRRSNGFLIVQGTGRKRQYLRAGRIGTSFGAALEFTGRMKDALKCKGAKLAYKFRDLFGLEDVARVIPA